MSTQILRADQNQFSDFFDGFRYLIKCSRQFLDVLALQRCYKCLRKLLGQFLCDAFVFATAVRKFFEVLGRLILLELFE